MPYNRSWAFNIGIKYSKSSILIFGDSVLIMDPTDFIEGLKSLDQYDMVSPYHTVLDLTPQETTLPLENMVKIDRAGRGEEDHQKINICGGISMFRKQAIQKIGGWSEEFLGWGGEDDFQTIKVQKFLTSTEKKAKCYHLYHSRENPDTVLYQKTLQLLEKLKSMSNEEVIRFINNGNPKIGMLNKYDNF